LDKNLDAFLRVMDSQDNSTGGGSASSIAGAMAAGLAGMVARLSMGKKDLEPSEYYEAIARQAEKLSNDLLVGSNTDSDAFAVVSDAFGLPKGTDEEKTARSQAIKDGMTLCAEVPLKNAAMCLEVIELCEKLVKKYNTNASSDLECAQHLAQAGLKGCAANVRVNLPYLKDEDQVRDLEVRLEAIENKS
jgi:formiminotetrahydrofolate cyclodeaminase